MLIDTHCHFNHTQLATDLVSSLDRAAATGVSAMIVVGFDMESSRQAVELACLYHGPLFAAVGVHPHDASTWTLEARGQLAAWAAEPFVCAIGEIGLDYYRDLSPRDQQANAFRAQLELARETKLPVIIHCRDAYDDTLTILEELDVQEIGGVMHCWAGSVEEARRTVGLGMHLGFGGTITYKSAENVRQALIDTPLDRILLETDAPYLAPMPYRGKRNEPAYVAIVAQRAAELRAVTLEEIARETTSNAIRCFPRLANFDLVGRDSVSSPLVGEVR